MTTPWWTSFDEAAQNSRRQRAETDLSELTLALEAATWFRGREVIDDCAS